MPPRSNPEDQRSDLHRAKVGVAVLATCLVETINDSDPGDQIEQLELLTWTRSFLTGFSFVEGQGEPLLDTDYPIAKDEAD